MKIEHIEAVLNELQEEDQTELTNLKQELDELQTQLPISVKELRAIKQESKRLELVDSIRRNDLLKLHTLLPLIEIPASLFLIFNIATNGAGIAVNVILSLITTILLADTVIVSETVYKRIDDEPNLFKRLINVAKKLRMTKRQILSQEISLMNQEEEKREEISTIKSDISAKQDRVTELRHELAYIDGNLQGVETIKNKYQTEDINDNTRVVEFVNEVEGRKLVKKPE